MTVKVKPSTGLPIEKGFNLSEPKKSDCGCKGVAGIAHRIIEQPKTSERPHSAEPLAHRAEPRVRSHTAIGSLSDSAPPPLFSEKPRETGKLLRPCAIPHEVAMHEKV